MVMLCQLQAHVQWEMRNSGVVLSVFLAWSLLCAAHSHSLAARKCCFIDNVFKQYRNKAQGRRTHWEPVHNRLLWSTMSLSRDNGGKGLVCAAGCFVYVGGFIQSRPYLLGSFLVNVFALRNKTLILQLPFFSSIAFIPLLALKEILKYTMH